MFIPRKKILTFCFLAVISLWIIGPVHGYVLQGAHVIDLMIEQLGEAQSLFVSQQLVFYRMASQVDQEITEMEDANQPLDRIETDLPTDQSIEVDENGFFKQEY